MILFPALVATAEHLTQSAMERVVSTTIGKVRPVRTWNLAKLGASVAICPNNCARSAADHHHGAVPITDPGSSNTALDARWTSSVDKDLTKGESGRGRSSPSSTAGRHHWNSARPAPARMLPTTSPQVMGLTTSRGSRLSRPPMWSAASNVYSRTDDGNALRLIDDYGRQFRRVADMRKWFCLGRLPLGT
jgi:hypothetical protein